MLIPWLVAIFSLSPAGLDSLKHLNYERLEVALYAYEQAVQYNIDTTKFISIINCESRFEKSRWGDCEGGYGKEYCDSFGVLQFQKPTWLRAVAKYKVKGDYANWRNQIDVAILMLNDGRWGDWFTCSTLAGADHGIKMNIAERGVHGLP